MDQTMRQADPPEAISFVIETRLFRGSADDSRIDWCALYRHWPLEQWAARLNDLADEVARHAAAAAAKAPPALGDGEAPLAEIHATLLGAFPGARKSKRMRLTLPSEDGLTWWRYYRVFEAEKSGREMTQLCHAARLEHLAGGFSIDLLSDLARWVAELWNLPVDRAVGLLCNGRKSGPPCLSFAVALPLN